LELSRLWRTERACSVPCVRRKADMRRLMACAWTLIWAARPAFRALEAQLSENLHEIWHDSDLCAAFEDRRAIVPIT
jgi:hypothetical protein